MKDYIYNEF